MLLYSIARMLPWPWSNFDFLFMPRNRSRSELSLLSIFFCSIMYRWLLLRKWSLRDEWLIESFDFVWVSSVKMLASPWPSKLTSLLARSWLFTNSSFCCFHCLRCYFACLSLSILEAGFEKRERLGIPDGMNWVSDCELRRMWANSFLISIGKSSFL